MLGVDLYDDKSYNDYGWVRTNGIMSAAEWDNFNHRLSQFDHNKYSEQLSEDGRVAMTTRDDNNRLGLVTVFEGGYESPKIHTIYRLYGKGVPLDDKEVTDQIETIERMREYIALSTRGED